MCVDLCVCNYIQYAHTHTHTHTCMMQNIHVYYWCVCVCVCVCMCWVPKIHTHMQIHTHTHWHSITHTYQSTPLLHRHPESAWGRLPWGLCPPQSAQACPSDSRGGRVSPPPHPACSGPNRPRGSQTCWTCPPGSWPATPHRSSPRMWFPVSQRDESNSSKDGVCELLWVAS